MRPGVERAMWEAGVSPALMSAAEREAYEEKKLKMRKAMGENLADDVAGEAPDARQRRRDFCNGSVHPASTWICSRSFVLLSTLCQGSCAKRAFSAACIPY
jgi:hypothetical protein